VVLDFKLVGAGDHEQSVKHLSRTTNQNYGLVEEFKFFLYCMRRRKRL